MSEFIINNPLYLHLLWVVALVAAFLGIALVFRRRAMARFVTANLHGKMAPQISAVRKWTKTLLLVGALLAMTAAMLDVRWGRTWREVPQRGVDVMFVLDVSHSMLAQDVTPNRLERAKQDILDIVREMQGDRVGLVTFAGDTAQKSPLTSNYREFQLMLDEVGPHSVSRGGSDLGRAIEMAARGFLDKSANHKAIIVFSDGEDQDSKPVVAAKALHEKRGIRIFTVGLGDEQKGARIPTRLADGRQSWLQYEGEDVWTKMNGQVLQEVALAADGAYVPAGTKHVSMDQVYKQHIASIEEQQYEQARVNTYIPRYQWFIGLALFLAGIEVFLRDVRKVRLPKPALMTATALFVAVSLGAAPASSQAAIAKTPVGSDSVTSDSAANEAAAGEQGEGPAVEVTPEATYNQAVDLYRAGKMDEAAAKWSEAVQSGKTDLAAKAHFNLGNCSYSAATKLREKQPEQAIGQLDKAIAHYRDSLKLNRGDQDARANIELAARLRDQIRQQEEQKKQQQEQEKQKQEQKQEQQKQEQQQQQQDQKQDQQQNQQDKQQEQKQQQNQNQQSQAEKKEDQKSDSKQDQQSSNEQQSQDQNKDEQQKDQQQKPEQQKSDQQKPDEQKSQQNQPEKQQDQSKQDQQKDDRSKQDESKKDSSQQDEQKEQQKQDQQSSKQDQAKSQEKQSQDQHEQQPQGENQQEKQDQQRPQPPKSMQGGDQQKSEKKEDEQPEAQQPKPDDKQDEKPEQKSGKKLEANSNEKAPEGTPMAEQSAAELKDGKNMSKEEAAKMLQAIRDRDLLRRMQQLRKEQSQRRPVEKDW